MFSIISRCCLPKEAKNGGLGAGQATRHCAWCQRGLCGGARCVALPRAVQAPCTASLKPGTRFMSLASRFHAGGPRMKLAARALHASAQLASESHLPTGTSAASPAQFDCHHGGEAMIRGETDRQTRNSCTQSAPGV